VGEGFAFIVLERKVNAVFLSVLQVGHEQVVVTLAGVLRVVSL